MRVNRIILALGSNLGDPDANLDRALTLISARVGSIRARSARITTAPVLHPETPTHGQRSFRNMALIVESALTPLEILDACHAIERELGRTREAENIRWAPRIIDIDIIAIEDLVVSFPQLTVPHPEMHKRRFVLEPLAEIWPDWAHPVLKLSAAELLRRLQV